MKSNGRKAVFIVSLGIIFIISNVYNYNFFIDQLNNDINIQIRDDLYLKTANSEIFIISPENKTYTEPMSGYYPGVYGFEDEIIGTTGTDIQFVDSWNGAPTSASIESDIGGHKNVLREEYSGATHGDIFHYFDTNHISGQYEFWFRCGNPLTVSQFLFMEGGLAGPHPQVRDGFFNYYDGAQHNLIPCNPDQWYQLKFEWYSNNTFDMYVDSTKILVGGENLNNMTLGPDRIRLTAYAVTTNYYDAVGYSWDPAYLVGDNLNEGLLFSFENSTTLDWMGYSLDGETNRTIFGNTTIAFPNRGSHIIQVFGNDSLGNIYHSPIRYFKIFLNLTGSPIYINGPADWSNAILQPWCSGSGTWSDPYIIEYLMIDGQNTDRCIEIRNSNVFFIIRHCIIYNGVFAGIFLMDTTNGQLICNNISDCGGLYGGIYFYSSCNNHTISGNTLNNNDWSGIHIESDCYFNTISRNSFYNNIQYGITLTDNNDYNNVTDNFFYFNNDGAIRITPATSENNRIERNIMVSKDAKYINDAGTNTILISNYYLTGIPSLFIEISAQSFSTSEFIIIFNVSSQCISLEVLFQSVQIWWNGAVVPSDNITDIGNGLYNVSLYPIFVESGEAPILLNMTIAATYHRDTYFETYLDVEPPEVVKFLQIEMTESSYSTEHFNLTFYIFDENNQSVNSAIIQMWWNGSLVSGDVINLGNGLYFVSLAPITVAPGENPILLTMIVSVDGYEDKPFETYIAVDPDILDKDGGRAAEEFPFVLTIIIASSISGGIVAAGALMFLLRKRKQISEVP